MVLGQIWQRRHRLPLHPGEDPVFVGARPILESMAERGGGDAKTALSALGRVGRGPLGRLATDLAAGLTGRTPPFVEEVGSSRLVRAFYDHSAGDGEAIFFGTDGDGPRAHMIAVLIDVRLGGIAKHIFLIKRLDLLGPDSPHTQFDLREVDVGVMSRRLRNAIALTDSAVKPQVDESFSNYRAIALARLDPLVADA